MAQAALSGSLSSAMTGNQDGSLKTALSSVVGRADAASTQFARNARAIAEHVLAGAANPRDVTVTADGKTLAQASDELWKTAQGELSRLLKARIAGFEIGAAIKLGFVVFALLITALVVYLVVRSIRAPLADLVATIRRFEAGDYETAVPNTQAGGNGLGKLAQGDGSIQDHGLSPGELTSSPR
jgi:methyl-accepting chemotaxis protein